MVTRIQRWLAVVAGLTVVMTSGISVACGVSGWHAEAELECVRFNGITATELSVSNECGEPLELRLDDCVGTCPPGLELDSMTDGVLALSHPNEATYDYTVGDTQGQVHLYYHENQCPSDRGDCSVTAAHVPVHSPLLVVSLTALAILLMRRTR